VVATLWRSQLSLLSNGLTRIGFAFLLTASLMVHQYVWNWLWAIPPAVAALLNLRLAWRVPHRTAGDLLSAVLLVPVELYLIMRVEHGYVFIASDTCGMVLGIP
jgi:biofilm PGA synthesis N-glycosyltransferase PgaC